MVATYNFGSVYSVIFIKYTLMNHLIPNIFFLNALI